MSDEKKQNEGEVVPVPPVQPTPTQQQDSIEVEFRMKLNLDPEKLRCLQDPEQGLTASFNVVT